MPTSRAILDPAELYAMVGSELFAAASSRAHDTIGLELELFPFAGAEGELRPVPLHPSNGWAGSTVAGLFRELEGVCGWALVDEGGGALALEREGGGRITLEPGGQIEYSGPACSTPSAALADLRDVVGLLAERCAGRGIRLLACGYNNLCEESALELQVRKPRYTAMDRHFAAIGPYGRRMMRATCALQINLDFGTTATTSERWRLANMIAPSLNAIFANSPHVQDGARFRSFRYEIWRHADPTRTGRLFDRPDLDPIADYLRFALDASVMLVRDGEGNAMPPLHPMTFGEWIAGSPRHGYPDREDWIGHLSTLFPDVRARGWMELRSVDALPARFWAVPVAMAHTVLYDDALRGEALERLELRHRRRDAGEVEHGGYWRCDYETGAELLALAIPHMDDPELAAAALEYQERFCALGRTPADLPLEERWVL